MYVPPNPTSYESTYISPIVTYVAVLSSIQLKAPAEASDSADSSEKREDPTAICYLDDRSLILEKWKCCNTETVGELWYGLLRYEHITHTLAVDAPDNRPFQKM